MPTDGKHRRPGPAATEEIFKELVELDERLLEALGERLAKLAKITPLAPALEKRLRGEWEARWRDMGLPPKAMREVFTRLNMLAPRPEAQPRRGPGQAFLLAPRREALDVHLAGPRRRASVQALTLIAAAAQAPCRLAPVVLNDPLVELAKALNQPGARLSWEGGALMNQPQGDERLGFDGASLHCGGEPFTFAALACLCLAEAGQTKFTGGPTLRFVDVAALNQVLTPLGARIMALSPNTPGLPARLEYGGRMAASVALPEDAPQWFVRALALTAWRFPEGLTLRGVPDAGPVAEALADAVDALRLCGVEAELDGGECRIPHATPAVPETPDLPLDADLAAYLLALPAFAGGSVRLTGRLGDDPAAAALRQGFADAGLTLVEEQGAVNGAPGKLTERLTTDMGRCPELAPLALALSLKAEDGGDLALPDDADQRQAALDFLDALHVPCEEHGGRLRVRPERPSMDSPWTAPGPWHALGLALAAYVRPGLALENPGELTGLWPRFWNFYNSLPEGLFEPRDKDDGDHDTPKRRRIRV